MTAPAERKNSLGPTVEQQDKAMARLQKRRRGDGFNPITGEPETGEAYDEARRDAAIAREDIKRNIRTEDPPSNRVLATSNAALQADNAALRAQVAELAGALRMIIDLAEPNVASFQPLNISPESDIIETARVALNNWR